MLTLVPLKWKAYKGRTSVSVLPSGTPSTVIGNSLINTPAPYPCGRGYEHSCEMCAGQYPRSPQWD